MNPDQEDHLDGCELDFREHAIDDTETERLLNELAVEEGENG